MFPPSGNAGSAGAPVSRGRVQQEAVRAVARKTLRIVPLISEFMRAGLRAHVPAAFEAFPVLAVLRRGPLTLGRLAETLHVTSATMSDRVTRLERKGWVERRRDPADRRRVLIALTEPGQARLRLTIERAERELAEVLGALSAPEIETVAAGLQILQRALAEFDEGCRPRTGAAAAGGGPAATAGGNARDGATGDPPQTEGQPG